MERSIQPAEWAPHDAVWLAWPTHSDLWGDNLTAAQHSFTLFARAIANVPIEPGGSPDSLASTDDGAKTHTHGERLEVLVTDARSESDARRALEGTNANFHRVSFGDIWLRDTAPIFVHDPDGSVSAHCFGFNGWGEKYVLDDDDAVAWRIARAANLRGKIFPFILEGGSVETDGDGTLLTSRQCLLNPNRNPSLSPTELERSLCDSLGAEKVLWVTDGLLNDHTDGHIDTIARFVSPGVIAVMAPSGHDDPNKEIFDKLSRELSHQTDARGRTIELVTVPSPGRVLDSDNRLMPASHLNFYIGNTTVIVPTYGTPTGDSAVSAIAALFRDRHTVGIDARAILSGGGAFHCISQQQPAARR